MMKTYNVVRSAEAQIDWGKIPGVKIDAWIEKPELPVAATAQLCWDDTHLHVFMTADEPVILARFRDDMSMVCRDSCLEMFLSPVAADPRYFNFEMNPYGASFIGFGHGREDLVRLHPGDIRKLLHIRTSMGNGHWALQYDIPNDFIRLFIPEFHPESGSRMRANFYKCGDDIHPEHELMWNPITNGNPDFHQPDFFGELVLK